MCGTEADSWTLFKCKKYIAIDGLYSFFYAERKKDFHFSGERHDFWELVYVDSGEISVIADNRFHMLKQGSVIFHKPMEFHTLSGNNKSPHNVLITSFQTSSKSVRFFNDKVFTLDQHQRKLISLFLEEGTKAFPVPFKPPAAPSRPEDIGAYQLAVGYLEQLMIDLVRKNSAAPPLGKSSLIKGAPQNALVEAIDTYLAENIYGHLQLQDVCEKFNMSKSSLCRLYKDATGKSIINHYIDLKIVCARHLIREGELNYTQISEKLGFTSIHHFTRTFKNRMDMSPSVYEKSILNE